MPSGISLTQPIWVTKSGNICTVTPEELLDAVEQDKLSNYGIFTVNLTTMEPDTIPVEIVTNQGPGQGVTLVDGEGLSATVSVLSGIIDMSDDAHPKPVVQPAGMLANHYGSSSSGKPGTSTIIIDEVTEKNFCPIECVYIGVPNVITDSFYFVCM